MMREKKNDSSPTEDSHYARGTGNIFFSKWSPHQFMRHL